MSRQAGWVAKGYFEHMKTAQCALSPVNFKIRGYKDRLGRERGTSWRLKLSLDSGCAPTLYQLLQAGIPTVEKLDPTCNHAICWGKSILPAKNLSSLESLYRRFRRKDYNQSNGIGWVDESYFKITGPEM
jgi:hypothetical protein